VKHHVLWTVCAAAVGLSAIIPPSDCRCGWISRAGGFIVAVGILVESWPVLRARSGDNLPMWTSPAAHAALWHAAVAAVVGTLLWAYGEPICLALSR
jgi:hypothetical protein